MQWLIQRYPTRTSSTAQHSVVRAILRMARLHDRWSWKHWLSIYTGRSWTADKGLHSWLAQNMSAVWGHPSAQQPAFSFGQPLRSLLWEGFLLLALKCNFLGPPLYAWVPHRSEFQCPLIEWLIFTAIIASLVHPCSQHRTACNDAKWCFRMCRAALW